MPPLGIAAFSLGPVLALGLAIWEFRRGNHRHGCLLLVVSALWTSGTLRRFHESRALDAVTALLLAAGLVGAFRLVRDRLRGTAA
jgi:hypothetical protein